MSRRSIPLAAVFLVSCLVAGLALAAGDVPGQIGPDNRIQPSGRKLDPVGRLTGLGNLPAGGALTPDGRFLWTVSAGRGRNDVRIVRVRSKDPQKVGKVIQRLPLPGASGGIAIGSGVAYVSGTPETTDEENQTAEDTPGKEGDVIHVFKYAKRSGRATRDGVIDVPPPQAAPPIQTFPPTEVTQRSWPRDLALSPDGKTLLAALNLADHAAIVNTEDRSVSYVQVGRYPYGAAILPDGTTGLVSNEADGTVSVIDLAAGSEEQTITVGPHLSHPEGIAVDPKSARAYVAVTHQDLIAVVETEGFTVERTLSVERPQGIGTAPVQVSVSSDGCRLLSANSGEDAVAVFSLPNEGCEPSASRAPKKAERILQHEGRVGLKFAESAEEEAAEIYGDEAEEEAEAHLERRPVTAAADDYALLGRVPVASYPVAAFATPKSRGRKLVWVAGKGLGVGSNKRRANEPPIAPDPGSAAGAAPDQYQFHYLPEITTGLSGILPFPSPEKLGRLTPKASRQIRPSNAEEAPADTPLRPDGPIEHVFYIVRENRTYDQILGDDPRGDGDPKMTLFGEDITPNVHALAERFPLLDHVYANSEASIDGHFWTSAAAVSDYVVKNWHQNYGGRGRPYDFGVYAVTWPSQRFLFDGAEAQGISWFNYGEAVAGTVPLNDLDRTAEENSEVAAKFAKSDLGPTQPGPQPMPPAPCFSNDASVGTNVISGQEVFDSTWPEGADQTNTESRFECFKQRFEQQLASPQGVPAFNYLTFANDHTIGTTPGARTPRAMIAENDWAVGEVVDLVSHSSIWESSLILVIEDDSQDGLDHVDAHRIPALAISPYAKRSAVVHTRYDFLSFIRSMELVVGMEPLNLFDALAVPMYDAFDADPSDNMDAYDAIVPDVDLLERNPEDAVNGRLSASLPLEFTDRTPQRILDRILWQYMHGADSQPPPPGPNASGLDEEAWQESAVTDAKALRELLAEIFEGRQEASDEDD